MKKAVKMKLISDANKNRRYYRDPNREPYETRNKFKDDYGNYGYEEHSRREDIPRNDFYDRDGRRHYDNGRFAPQNRYRPVGFDLREQEEVSNRYFPPIYNAYHDYKNSYPENQDDTYYLNAKFQMDKENKKHHPKKLDKETAEKWVSQMSKPDKKGEKGGKWTYEETTQILKERDLNMDPVLFFVAMNMMFSDYGKTLAKHNVNSVNLYIDLAMDWIEDDDVAAGKEKTADYYYCVVK